jgi:apolipoprotein N-acyltransferase
MMAATDERRLWMLVLGGGLALFLVQPPADLWWAAWIAPLPWLRLVTADVLPGRRPWRALWIGGFLHWLATIHWLRLPHPATSIGWVLLSAYLAIYVPAFVWLARRLVHRWRWPLVPAAAVAWMACEQLRGWVLGGFTFAGLGHTQWRWTTLLQTADIAGAVGVSGLVIAVAAALSAALPTAAGWQPRRAVANLALAGGLLGATLAYGSWRLATAPPPRGAPLALLLVQGSIDTELKHDPDAATDVARHYDDLTMAGLAAWPAGGRPDLIVWPETMWRWGLVEIDPAEILDEPVVERVLGPAPADADAAERADRQARCRRALAEERFEALAVFARRYAAPWLVGLDKQAIAPGETRHFNCGLFLDADGRPLACYAKLHPVMFGEYIPLADRFPVLYRLSPLPAGLTAGRELVAVEIARRRVAVNICYETALPDAVRTLVNGLDTGHGPPDVLVNLTNDGWFWGSSELDMHLVAAIFRAVEVRTPIAIAANTGFSAAIDGCGRLLERGPRRAAATLAARLHPDGRRSPWRVTGTLPTAACVAVAAAVTLAAARERLSRGRLDRLRQTR